MSRLGNSRAPSLRDCLRYWQVRLGVWKNLDTRSAGGVARLSGSIFVSISALTDASGFSVLRPLRLTYAADTRSQPHTFWPPIARGRIVWSSAIFVSEDRPILGFSGVGNGALWGCRARRGDYFCNSSKRSHLPGSRRGCFLLARRVRSSLHRNLRTGRLGREKRLCLKRKEGNIPPQQEDGRLAQSPFFFQAIDFIKNAMKFTVHRRAAGRNHKSSTVQRKFCFIAQVWAKARERGMRLKDLGDRFLNVVPAHFCVSLCDHGSPALDE